MKQSRQRLTPNIVFVISIYASIEASNFSIVRGSYLPELLLLKFTSITVPCVVVIFLG